MQLGGFVSICKPTFQVPNKPVERLFVFRTTLLTAKIRTFFVLVHFFTN